MRILSERRTSTVYVGLGSNVGDRLRHLRRALLALAVHPEIEVTAVSGVYETEYVGTGDQDPYLNACLELRTNLTPNVLLSVFKAVELREGRVPGKKWAPRPIDVDILLFDDHVRSGADLKLPHPELRKRAFVLEPLAEIAARVRIPDSGETIADACAKIRRKSTNWIRSFPEAGLLPARRGPNKEDWRAALAVHCR